MVVAKMWSRNIDYYLRDNEENQETIPVMVLKQQYIKFNKCVCCII